MVQLHVTVTLLIGWLLIVDKRCHSAATVNIDSSDRFTGVYKKHKWQTKLVELNDDLLYDIELINGDKIKTFSDSSHESMPNPLIFIHGWLDSRLTWTLITKHILNIVNSEQIIIMLSLRGFGDSQIFPIYNSVFNYNQFVDDILLLLLPKLGFKSNAKYNLIGHSMGGGISMKAAINYPNNISKLILIGSSPAFNCSQLFNFDETKNEPTFIQRKQITQNWNGKQVENGWITKQFSDLMDIESIKANSMAARMSFNYLSVTNITNDIIKTVKNYDIKTMIMFGEYDLVPVEHQRKYGKQINAKIVEFKDCGHDPMYRHPQDVANKIVQFCYNHDIYKQDL
eukprot:199710_1